MDCGRNYIDISDWMLFEATGDSEFDSEITCSVSFNGDVGKFTSPTSSPGGDVEQEDVRLNTAASLAEGDAFSCSCNDGDNNYFRRGFDGFWFGDFGNEEEEYHGEQAKRGCDEEDEDEEDGDAVDQVRKGIHSRQPEQPPGAVEFMMKNMREIAEAGRRKKPKACGKPAELISQKDTDRLFWEACLSS